MQPLRQLRALIRLFVLGTGLVGSSAVLGQDEPASRRGEAFGQLIEIVKIEGEGAEILMFGHDKWVSATPGFDLRPGDQVRALDSTRIAVQIGEDTIVTFGGYFHYTVEPPQSWREKPGFSLWRGLLYLFHRGQPADLRLKTRIVSTLTRGTEFNMSVGEDGSTVLTMIEGEVDLFNELGMLRLRSNEQGEVKPGERPVRTAVLDTRNVIQWALYYPAILDLRDLELSPETQRALALSLEAYRNGDLLEALAQYPVDRHPVEPAEIVYRAALLLSVGQVERAGGLLDEIAALGSSTPDREMALTLAHAIRRLIAAVKARPIDRELAPRLATEWMAESYDEQAAARLPEALAAARRAVAGSPDFGFGWSRVAELEFSFGRIREATDAVKRSLELAPRNPEAWTLMGYLLAAKDQIPSAIQHFDYAIEIDGALGNAWLGRGLCRIRQGDSRGGRADLLIAAAVEPQRSILRSYLAKAYADSGDREGAGKELGLAEELDDDDPTVWLYSALLNQQYNRINQAIRDLERSQALNKNRQVYRSRMLLDQDRAVRSANLARIYEDAGMKDFSLWEASRAVTADYANYSAHLFLAGSYDQLRDPKLINLRYETAANAEYLVANLLAPVGAGTLSRTVSQQEYSRLFEQNRLGVVSSTEYYSSGDWVQRGAHYGILGDLSYSFDAFYRTENGQRPNNDLEQMQLALQLRLQATPQDSVYFEGSYADLSGGDLFQYYDQDQASPAGRTMERQSPFLTFGYHREWSPGQHTLLLGGWLDDEFELQNPKQPTLFYYRLPDESVGPVLGVAMTEQLRVKPEIFTIELQQIAQATDHTTILGARYQVGDFETANLQHTPSHSTGLFDQPVADQMFDPGFERVSVYGYHHWQIHDSLLLVGGLSYDWITFPENIRFAPVSGDEETIDAFLPKVGLVWNPWPETTLRAAYTRSLSSASFEQSYQLEPTQIAGFLQSYRSIMPESVAGANAGAKFETAGVGVEQRFKTGTYVGLVGEILDSRVDRTVGAFEVRLDEPFALPSGLREDLDYQERSLLFTLNQLITDEWSVGVRYRLTAAELDDEFVGVPDSASEPGGISQSTRVESVLHQVTASTLYNHSSGFFAAAEALWQTQSNKGYSPDQPGDDFWQFNLFAGYRWPRRKAELAIGLLNLTDQDYRLNPLTLYQELPRERTLTIRLRLNL